MCVTVKMSFMFSVDERCVFAKHFASGITSAPPHFLSILSFSRSLALISFSLALLSSSTLPYPKISDLGVVH